MANINLLLDTISKAIYGSDMRSALHDAIEILNHTLEKEISELNQTVETKVDKTQYASTSNYGLVKLSSKGGVSNSNGLTVNTNADYGTSRSGDGKVIISSATKSDIDERSNAYKPITPSTLVYAVNSVIGKSIDELNQVAHTHDNKSALDEINSEIIENLKNIGESIQITEYIPYINERFASVIKELAILQTALGIIGYDGGWFEEEYGHNELDGGYFEDELTDDFDCGDFTRLILSVQTNNILDGGLY